MKDEHGSKGPILAVAAAVGLNSFVYCYIAYLKYQSFNANVFDLGVSSELLYSVLHGGFSLGTIAMNKLIYLPLALLYNVYPVPVFAQYIMIVFLSGGAFPIYLIAKHLTDSSITGIIFSVLYLIYFPLGGVFWFDFHFMAFFPTFFLFGIHFYLAEKRKASFLMMVLASITDFLAPVIVAFFAIYAVYNDMKEKGIDPFRNRYSISLLVATFIVFFGALAYFGIGYLDQYTSRSIVTYVPEPLIAPLYYRLAYFVYLLMPLLFLPLFAPDFLIVIIPYFVLAVYNGYYPYVNTLLYQYPSLTVAAIFVSAILGITRLMKTSRIAISRKGVMRFLYVITAFNVVLMLFLTPIGNIVTNGHGSQQITTYLAGMNRNYNAADAITYTSSDGVLWNITRMVPAGSSVLIQNNMPQLTSGYNWTLPDFFNFTSFPEYVVVDPYNPSFYTVYFTSNISRTMSSEIGPLLLTDNYGVLVSYDGIMLLKRGYTGTPTVFSPVSDTYDAYNSTLFKICVWLAPAHYVLTFSGKFIRQVSAIIQYRTSIYGPLENATLYAITSRSYSIAYMNLTESIYLVSLKISGESPSSWNNMTIRQLVPS